jgi:hypothetical protein
MSRIFHRPMFRIGGSAGGITSGLRRGFSLGGSGSEREILELKEQIENQPSVEEKAVVEETPKQTDLSFLEDYNIQPPEAPGFDWGTFGLNLMGGPSKGDIWTNIADAGKEPYSQWKQGRAAYDMNKYKHKLAERQFNLEVYKAMNPKDKIALQEKIDYLMEQGFSKEEAFNRAMPEFRKPANPKDIERETREKEALTTEKGIQYWKDVGEGLIDDNMAKNIYGFEQSLSDWQDAGYDYEGGQLYIEDADWDNLTPNPSNPQEWTISEGKTLNDHDYKTNKIYVNAKNGKVYKFTGAGFIEVSLSEDIKS